MAGRRRRLEDQPNDDLPDLGLGRRGELGQSLSGPRKVQREEGARRATDGGLGLSLALGDDVIGCLGIGDTAEDLDDGVTKGTVGPEEHPGHVAGPESLDGAKAGEEIVPLLCALEALLGEPSQNGRRFRLEDRHGRRV